MNYWNRTDTWTTRDGTVLDLEDIEQDHAENIIAMIYPPGRNYSVVRRVEHGYCGLRGERGSGYGSVGQ